MGNFEMKGIRNAVYFIAVTSFTIFVLNGGCYKDLKGIACLIWQCSNCTGHSDESPFPALAPWHINQSLTHELLGHPILQHLIGKWESPPPHQLSFNS